MSPAATLKTYFTEAELRERAVAFDRIDRRSFLYPSLGGATLDLFTLTNRELNGGVITGVGTDSPQWDFFARDSLIFTVQRAQAIGQQYRHSDGTVASELQYARFKGYGSCETPWPVYLMLKQGFTFSLVVIPRTGAPATGFNVVNVFVRTVGFFFR
jgi:hypothetical protein